MVVEISVQNVEKLTDGVWRTELQPAEAMMFGHLNRHGNTTVVFLKEKPDYRHNALKFSKSDAMLVNLGSGKNCLLVLDTKEYGGNGIKEDQFVEGETNYGVGDENFLNNLAKVPTIESIGKKLLSRIRKRYSGSLRYYEASGRYVETPDNFWTIKIQPRDKSLSMTVRGLPRFFDFVKKMELKKERAGYSRFKFTDENQVDEIMMMLDRVKKKY